MTAHEVLTLAAASAEQCSTSISSGHYLYVETHGWYLKTTVSAGTSRSMMVPVRRRQWIAEDGSGRITSERGKAYLPSTTGQEMWPAVRPGEQPLDDGFFSPGRMHLIWHPDSLSGNPAKLREQLVATQPDDQPANVFEAVRALYSQQPVASAVRAAVLRVIADLPDIRIDGAGTEFAGRTALRVSCKSNHRGSPIWQALTIDGDDGSVLAHEKASSISASPVETFNPPITSRTIYVRSARTDSLQDEL